MGHVLNIQNSPETMKDCPLPAELANTLMDGHIGDTSVYHDLSPESSSFSCKHTYLLGGISSLCIEVARNVTAMQIEETPHQLYSEIY